MSQQYKIKGTDGAEYGPVSTEELQQWVAQNRCTPKSLVEVDGSGEWVPLATLPKFQDAFAASPAASPASAEGEGGVSTVIPYKNVPALIAYYVGVFCIICPPLLCFPAIILGVIGLRRVKENPEVKGTAHAWIGILSGSFFLLLSIVIGFGWIVR
ncbi:MAG: DUF4339 domain-containing protein [Verrucomicrobia bacterium]|jgi:hypothetical protein|nr:DUF4339 domain-containing protein [Verrucomicrobiota bacterium]MBT3911896.1 DUF4339 domain-containing protein [Verrucomicrobiota bacterium]MBT4227425.1 DUF4339 domain-containing protein [Verrucomicrobiota bacterium]MBT4623662.1 DUF4339 domain-containing protein [Verrucomicrobiota bacterium]MBT5311667.1 DUF4339 domain-containing protein [Verrucomicrobiota bacterium]